jgi:lactoylglutathione lyase
VKDIEKSISFYESITELKVAQRRKEGTAELAFLVNGVGETQIELICIPQVKTSEGNGFFICFETDNLDKKHKLAQEKDLNPSPIQEPADQTRYFYVYDPDGVSVQLRSF